MEEKINTNKNINYPPTLPPKYPSTPVTNRHTAESANTVYVRIQKPIEYLKNKYKKTQQRKQHRQLSMITTPQQHHQSQCPIHTNIYQPIIWWQNISSSTMATTSMMDQENAKQWIH